MLFSTKMTTPIGTLQLMCDEKGLVEITFPGSRIKTKKGKAVAAKDSQEILTMAAQQLQEYFTGNRTNFNLPISLHGTDFQQQVWRIIHDIPYGRTMTYGEIAGKLGGKGKARAVGGAAHANPLPLVIPCHRVIGANGSLTGFGGGLELKERLLNLETKCLQKRSKK